VVSNERDLLREAFERHEKDTPDAAEVYAHVQHLAKGYRLRRWGVQAAGGAVLGAGLIAGAIQLPQFLPGGDHPTANGVSMVAPAAAPSASAVTEEQAFEAYFKQGYGYDEALKLATIWKKDAGNPAAIKVEAGRRLLAGETLPVQPMPDAPGAGVPETEVPEITQEQQKAISEFFNTGYTYDDAVKLAKIWKLEDAYAAKIEGGERLLDDKKLPVRPSGQAASADERARSAYFDNGYDFADAEKLAQIWKMDKNDIGAIKLKAGKRLLAGKKLPIEP
jgi:hypothetical protein